MWTSSRHSLALILLSLIGLLAVSCSSSDDTTTGGAASSGDAAAAGADDTAASVAESDQEDEDVDGEAAKTDASAEAYCSTKAAAEALLDAIDPFDPMSVETAIRKNIELIDAAIDIAPPEIRDDIRMLRESYDEYVVVLEENDWDFFASALVIETLDDRPVREAAEERLEAWEDANCGFVDDDDVDEEDAFEEDPFADPEALEAILSTDAGRAFMIEIMIADGEVSADQAGCLLDNLDVVALAALATGDESSPEVLGMFFEVAMVCELEMFGFDEMQDAEDAVDTEFIEAMLASETGRVMLIDGIVEEGELTAEQATCLLDNLDTETLVILLAEKGEELPPEVMISLLQLLDTCDLGELFAD